MLKWRLEGRTIWRGDDGARNVVVDSLENPKGSQVILIVRKKKKSPS